MLAQEYFYHASTRRYVILFGSIFDGFKILKDTKYIGVPIRYGGGYVYASPDKDRDTRKKKTPILPHMSYKMMDMRYDEERKGNSRHKITRSGVDHGAVGEKMYVYNRVPYTFSFALMIRTKTTDDMLQIVEQFMPYFSPSITFEIKDTFDEADSVQNKSVEPVQSVPITMMDVSMEDDDNVLDDLRFKEWTFTFELKGWLYKEVNTSPIILKVIENYKDGDTEELLFTQETTS